MRRVVRSARMAQPVERVWDACLRLLTAADPSQGVVSRRCEPSPPAAGAVVTTTVRDGRGDRELRAVVTELEPPHRLVTETEAPAAVRTTLTVTADGDGARVMLLSEAESGLPVWGGAARLLDLLLLGRAQRRAARATLRRLGGLLAEEAGGG